MYKEIEKNGIIQEYLQESLFFNTYHGMGTFILGGYHG